MRRPNPDETVPRTAFGPAGADFGFREPLPPHLARPGPPRVPPREAPVAKPGTPGLAWLQRFAWMDNLGDRWWPVLGAVYVVVAVKRVRGMRLIGLVKKERRKVQAAPAVVANRQREPVDMEC